MMRSLLAFAVCSAIFLPGCQGERTVEAVDEDVMTMTDMAPAAMSGAATPRIDPGLEPRVDPNVIDMSIADAVAELSNEELAETIRDDSDLLRVKVAMQEVRVRGARELLPVLQERVRATSEEGNPDDVASVALGIIAWLDPEGGLDLAREMLQDPRRRVRSAAAMALGRAGDASAIPVLVELANDPLGFEGEEVDRMILILDPGAKAGVPVEKAHTDGYRIVPNVVNVLLSLGAREEAVDALVAAVRNGTPREMYGFEDHRVQAAEMLVRLGEREAIEEMLAIYDEMDPASRAAMTPTLFEIGTEEAFSVARGFLTGPFEVESRSSAVTAVADARVFEAAPVLAELLSDPDERMQVVTIDALRKIGGEEVVGPLSRYVEQEANRDVRAAAVIALEEIQGRLEE